MEQRVGVEQSRVALIAQYIGTAYNGWQIQNGGRTLQGEIEQALAVFFQRRIRITASGRTDAGVHAMGQVAHFDAPEKPDLRRLCNGLNGILGKDVSIINAFSVNPDFHARFDARRRIYRYCIHNDRARSPFAERRAMWVREPLDVAYLEEVARYCVGERDFASFCKKSEAAKRSSMRRIERIDVRREGTQVIFEITGNAFLHHMVRILVGTMIHMHRLQSEPSSIIRIIEARDRTAAGATAPAYGLYLMKVEYDPPLHSYESAF